MKYFCILLVVSSLSVLGCSGGDKADAAKDQALKAAFTKKPDINTLSPGMRKYVDGMIAASKNGKANTNAKPPAPAGQ